MTPRSKMLYCFDSDSPKVNYNVDIVDVASSNHFIYESFFFLDEKNKVFPYDRVLNTVVQEPP